MVEIRKAELNDNLQLINLLNRCPTGKAMVIRQERYGDFFRRSEYLDRPQTFTAWDGNTVVGTIECSLSLARINGEILQAGYLHGIAVDPEYKRLGISGKLLGACEEYLREESADFGYCTVSTGNFPYLGLLGRSGYTERAQLQQVVLLGNRKRAEDQSVRRMIVEDLPEVADLMNHTYHMHDLYPGFTAESLREQLNRLAGFDLHDVFVVENHGEIAACLGCWPISKIVSSVVLKWDRKLQLLTQAAGHVKKWINFPHIPKTGEAFRHCLAYPIAYKHSPRELAPLWSAVHQHIEQQKMGSLIVNVTNSNELRMLETGGFTIRGGTSLLLMKPYTDVVLTKSRPLFVPPLE